MRMNISFYTKKVRIEEQEFKNIPHRGSLAIQLLFNLVDVRSILYMWKAMLFDCHVILIST